VLVGAGAAAAAAAAAGPARAAGAGQRCQRVIGVGIGVGIGIGIGIGIGSAWRMFRLTSSSLVDLRSAAQCPPYAVAVLQLTAESPNATTVTKARQGPRSSACDAFRCPPARVQQSGSYRALDELLVSAHNDRLALTYVGAPQPDQERH
jgi:hypothetical protein